MEFKFGRIGLGLLIFGGVLFLASLFVRGNEPAWFLLVPSAMFVMTGIQFGTTWMLIKTLATLSVRELNAASDLGLDGENADNAVVFRRDRKATAEINKALV